MENRLKLLRRGEKLTFISGSASSKRVQLPQTSRQYRQISGRSSA